MKIKTPGLVIKETPIGENDKLLFILTKDKGIVRAFADGVRRMKSKNSAGVSLFCYSDFTLYKNKDTYKVSDSIPIEMFFDLRYDLEGLSLAQYFCEMAYKLTPEESEPSPDMLRLILNSLYFLTSRSKDKELIKAVTELKLISISGFMPDLTICEGCQEDNTNPPYYFSYREGSIFCEKCKKNAEGEVIRLSNTLLAAMRHIIYSDFKKIYSFEIPKKDLSVLSSITEAYVKIQSDSIFKTLEFYKSVKEPAI